MILENEVTIKRDEKSGIVTFQAKGEIEFLENITNHVIANFTKANDSNANDFVKAYDSNNGYIGKSVDIDKDEKDTPEHYVTGIKRNIGGGGNKYKCRYICPNCGTKENKYLDKHSEYMHCRVCNERLSVTWMEDYSNVKTDEFKNFAFAGEFNPKI